AEWLRIPYPRAQLSGSESSVVVLARFPVHGHGLVRLTLLVVENAHEIVGARIYWLELDAALQRIERVIDAAQLIETFATVEVGERIVGAHLDGALQLDVRLRVESALEVEDADVHIHIGARWIEPLRAFELALRPVEATERDKYI